MRVATRFALNHLHKYQAEVAIRRVKNESLNQTFGSGENIQHGIADAFRRLAHAANGECRRRARVLPPGQPAV